MKTGRNQPHWRKRPPRKSEGCRCGARKRIAAAQRARWAKARGESTTPAPAPELKTRASKKIHGRRTMSPEARARIVAAQKTRRAAFRRAKKGVGGASSRSFHCRSKQARPCILIEISLPTEFPKHNNFSPLLANIHQSGDVLGRNDVNFRKNFGIRDPVEERNEYHKMTLSVLSEIIYRPRRPTG